MPEWSHRGARGREPPGGDRTEARQPAVLWLLILAVLVLVGTLLALLLGGCAEKIVTSPLPNQAPETRISSDAPQPYLRASYRVHLSWVGEDADGFVTGYYWAWDDTLDAGGNPAWHFTAAADSTFEVSADSCASPPCEGQQAPFFDYHTFWVKAVDDQGAEDPTPAHRTFTATTIAPEAWLTMAPSLGEGCLPCPPHVYVAWRGEDPDGRVVGYWYKWGQNLFGRHPYSQGPDPAANGWVFVPAETTFTTSDQVEHTPEWLYHAQEFAVFAVDDAGAVQQVTRRGWAGERTNWDDF